MRDFVSRELLSLMYIVVINVMINIYIVVINIMINS